MSIFEEYGAFKVLSKFAADDTKKIIVIFFFKKKQKTNKINTIVVVNRFT